MDREQVNERLDLLRQEFNERQALRRRLAQELAQLDRELEQRRGGILELELLIQQDVYIPKPT